MKTKYLIYSIALLALIFPVSCKKFLDQQPQTSLTADQAFEKLENIDPLITGLYTSWRNIRKDRGGFVFQLGDDEAQQGAYQVATDPDQSALDKYNGNLRPSNNALTAQWDSRWLIVNTSAQAIYALQLNEEDEAKRTELLGEASFIWSALCFELTQYWGEIAVIDIAKREELGTGRQQLPLVYEYLINYLQYAVDHLPETQSDKRRVTKYAAMALLGKVYMSAPTEAGVRDYQKAADMFNAIISSGKYSLVSNYADLFDPGKPNSTESLYEYQFNNTYPDNNQTQWQMGSRALANVDGNCYFGGYDLMVPTQYCYQSKDNGGVWEEGDQRRDASIRYDFTYNGQTPPLASGFGGDELDPHVKKYEDLRTQGTLSFWYSGKNIIYLRYADVLLCYAECLNELNRTSEAVDIVNNQVRTRAYGGVLPEDKRWSTGMSADDFRTNMLDERMRELAFEGWRRMDLIRSGKFLGLVKARNKWTNQSNAIQPFNVRYPIPLTEILQNPDLTDSDQNPGY